MANKVAKKLPSSGFQLPALDIPSTSLTAGTSIPAPPPSPPPKSGATPPSRGGRNGALLDSPPQTPVNTESPNPLRSHPTSSHSLSRQYTLDAAKQTQQQEQPEPASPAPNNPKRTSSAAESATDSPPPAKRPMSVRKFLGLRSLIGRGSSDVYANGAAQRSSDKLSNFSGSNRPDSRMSSAQPSLRKKRSSLMLLGRRGSAFFGLTVDEEPEDAPRSTAQEKKTPPPTLPGFESLKASKGLRDQEGGFLGGGDMFRNITIEE